MPQLLVILVALFVLTASSVFAQKPDHPSFVAALIKNVVVDPTTYAPAIVTWKATRLDWQSSQVFFQNGWLEHNHRFTVSGLNDDTPIGFAAGNRQILNDAFNNLQRSLVNNTSERIVENLLIPRYPQHHKLIHAIGWIERSAVASFLSYHLSASHFQQWQHNKHRAQELGY